MAITSGITGQTFNDQEVKEWMAGKTDAQVAQRSAELGLNKDQISTALTIGRGGDQWQQDPTKVDQWVNDTATNGYQWADNGAIIAAARGNLPQTNMERIGTPSRWEVTPDQTVEGRINNLTDPNNPIIQQARFRANAAMNDRGLLNSSIAATAADSAAYEAAIPIAQADAATTAKAASYNADQQNQFTLEGSRQGSQMDIARLNADTQKQLSVMDNANREKAAAITASNNTLIQTNSQASSAFNQAMAAVNNITNNAQMDANAKTQATANVWASLISQLNVLGSVAGLNLTQTLSFANQPGFNAQGQYVGFNADGTTVGTETPAPATAPSGIVEAERERF